MRLVVALCSVTYGGRLDTVLPAAVRAILLKRDGSVAVHSDDRAYKPQNWMTQPRHVETPPPGQATPETPVTWIFGNSKETLVITIEEVLTDTEHALDIAEPGLTKTGTEKELQAWLAEHPELFGAGWQFVAREYPTGAGPVDLLMMDEDGCRVAVEVKRTASIGAVDQVSRYVEAIAADGKPVKGLVVAFDVRPRARLLAEQRGFMWLEVDKAQFLDENNNLPSTSTVSGSGINPVAEDLLS